MRLTESILHELNRQDIMSNQDVIDIMNSFSSRQGLNYKIEGNQAEFEDGTMIKFVLNDDDEIEYYFINSQGDASKTALVYDWSLLDKLTESSNLNESVDTSSLAKFIKDSVETLLTTDYTNCKYNLDEVLAVFVGWSDGYDETPEDYEIAHKETPTWRINAAIKVRNEAMWTDLDYLTTPYYVYDGEVYQCQFTVSKQDDYTYLADSLLKAYDEIKELLASGELTLGDE